MLFQGIAGKKLRLYTILEKSKETVLEFYNGTEKFCKYINGLIQKSKC